VRDIWLGLVGQGGGRGRGDGRVMAGGESERHLAWVSGPGWREGQGRWEVDGGRGKCETFGLVGQVGGRE
jgi:hypothetical protein